MSDYGTKRSAALAYILGEESSTSASDSDAAARKAPAAPKSRDYRLWSFTVEEEGNTVHGAIESLGETYTSGKISRFEFENRTALIEHFSKFKPPEDLPFIMEEGGEGEVDLPLEDQSQLESLGAHCWYSAVRATQTFCYVCSSCFTECYRRL